MPKSENRKQSWNAGQFLQNICQHRLAANQHEDRVWSNHEHLECQTSMTKMCVVVGQLSNLRHFWLSGSLWRVDHLSGRWVESISCGCDGHPGHPSSRTLRIVLRGATKVQAPGLEHQYIMMMSADPLQPADPRGDNLYSICATSDSCKRRVLVNFVYWGENWKFMTDSWMGLDIGTVTGFFRHITLMMV